MANTEIVQTNEQARPLAGTTSREDLTSRELATTGETAVTAAAAQASAAVQARYAMALRRPRDLDQVRVALLKECRRPGLAKVAIYNKPIGKGVTGPSIRFAEAAMRAMGNLYPETRVVYDDEAKRIVNVSVTDLETNLTFSQDVTIEKTVERSKLPEGDTALGQRKNSRGYTVYLVRATEDDLLNKVNALVSKALRSLSLRLVPGDLVDEALDTVRETLQRGAEQDPDGERKKIADAFAAIGIQPQDLAGYLGHDLGKCTPGEVVVLRGIYQAIRDGETTWSQVLASVQSEAASPARKSTADLRLEAKAKREADEKAKAVPAGEAAKS